MATTGAFLRPLTSFVGRSNSVAELSELLDGHRLVTLTGSGGCGKTRLALEVASSVESRFADGGAFVDLAPVDSPAIVTTAVAAATGVNADGAGELADLVGDALAQRQLLLVIDNCERVLDACAALVHSLLMRCPELVVLATSRSPLGIGGEVTWRVPSLSMPFADADDPIAEIHRSETGQLLLDRAQLALPGYELDPDDVPAVMTICRRLDGIPLAIELAASRLRTLDATEVARGLEDRFRLLTAGLRTAPPRQRTLEASIDWSHELLEGAERVLFRRLAVFAAGFTVEAAEIVCADDALTPTSIRSLLADLVDRSLLHVDDTEEAARYRLLETVRQYAQLRLEESGEEANLRHRHLDHLLLLAARFDAVALTGKADETEFLRIEALVDDVRGALEWSMASGRVADGLRLAADLRRFWINRNRNHEGLSWLAALLEEDHREDTRSRTMALVTAAHLCLYTSDPEHQGRLAAEAHALAGQLGDVGVEGQALLFVGWSNIFLEPDAARAPLIAARDAAHAAGDTTGVLNAHIGLGWASATAGDLPAAREALAAGVAVGRKMGSSGIRYVLTMLGYVDILEGRLADGMATLEEAASWFGGDFDRFNRNRVATWLALVRFYQGAYDEARQRLADAVASARVVGNTPVYPLVHLGLLERAVGCDDAAITCLEEARPMLKLQRLPWFEVQAVMALSDSMVKSDAIMARALRHEAMTLAEAGGNPLARTVAAIGLARGAVQEGDRDRARTLVRSALRTAVGANYALGAIDALEASAVLAAADGVPNAAQLLAAVDAERARTGYARFPVDEAAYANAIGFIESAGSTNVDGAALPFGDAVVLALGGDSRPARPAAGWESLTPAEERVARLVAEGLSNPEIGERLFISRRTVQAHLGHVFAKLGVGSRAELAAAMSRRQSPSTPPDGGAR